MELIITEKPSAAKMIASALSDSTPVQVKNGKVSYYEITHNKKKIVVASAAGHLYGLEEKEKTFEYPKFDIEWKPTHKTSKNAKFTKAFLDNLTKLAKKADSFTVACDYDIEGEVIGLNCVRFACKQKDASRMKFSTLTKSEIQDSYKNKAKTLNWGQARAGETRHFLDWMYGINLSRALMSSLKKAGTFKVLSTGRVQAPALKIVVDRELEIRSFKPEKYWQLRIQTNKLEAQHEKDKFDKREEAETAKENTSKEAIVKELISTIKKQFPYPAFDLGSLQIEAHSNFRYTPKITLSIAQKLYLAGLISYPRTSSQKLPAQLGLNKILKKLSTFYKEAATLEGKIPVQGKKDDPAHPAIFPTGQKPKELSDQEKKVYDLITRRFLSAFGQPAEREYSTIKLESNTENYIARGVRTIKQGWFKIYKPYVKLKEIELPELKKEEKLSITKKILDEKETQPPRRYTQASLVSALEKRSLGTKATRAEIVDTLFSRGYIDGKSLIASDLGIDIISILKKFVPEIIDVELTKEIEEEMQEIRDGKTTEEEILKKTKPKLIKILTKFRSQELEIGNELKKAYSETLRKDSELGVCSCGGKLKIKFSKKKQRFVGCDKYPDCTNTFPLPRTGKIIPTEKACETCSTPIIQIGRRTVCINPDCKSKKTNGTVKEKPCPKCDGTLILRKSVYGEFMGCSNYPKCKQTEKILNSKSSS